MHPETYLPETMTILRSLMHDDTPALFNIAAYALFSLEPLPAGVRYAPMLNKAELWPSMVQGLGKQGLLDRGFPKQCAEFLVYGSCHTSEPVYAYSVNVRVGQKEKALHVFGPRDWNSSGGIERLSPFRCIPVDWEHAYGGPEYAYNPSGMGHKSASDAFLPHIEAPNRGIGSRSDTPKPAGFTAMPIEWPQRSRHLGAFDNAWRRNRWPHLPLDTTPEYHNAAPEDQRLPGFFTGDESICLENMHPTRPVIETALPGVRGRLFLKRRDSLEKKELEEIPLRPDTLWLFPDLERGVLLFRGGFSCSDDEAEDIELFTGAWEPLASPPLPESHYRQDLFERMRADNDGQKTHAGTLPAARSMEAAVPETPPPAAGAVTVPTMFDPDIESFKQELSVLENEVEAELSRLGLDTQKLAPFMPHSPLPEPLDPTNFAEDADELRSLEQFLATRGHSMRTFNALPEFEQEMLRLEHLEFEVHGFIEQHGIVIPEEALLDPLPAETPLAADAPEEELRFDEAISSLRARGHDTSELEAILASLAKLEQKLDKLALPEAPAEEALAPKLPAQAPSVSSPDARGRLLLLQQQKAPLHGCDFSGADLSGMDLSGLHLSHCDFRGANLENCDLRNAVLEHANLSEAQLSGANLDHCRLNQAILAHTSGKGTQGTEAEFHGADFQHAHFVDCRFDNADFTQAHLSHAVFDSCSMTHTKCIKTNGGSAALLHCDLCSAAFDQSELHEADFSGSHLDNASFTYARTPHIRLMGVRAKEADFQGCELSGARGNAESCLDKSRFEGAQLESACWSGASLRETVFDSATMNGMDCSKADLTKSSIIGCRVRNATLSKAKLHDADLFGSDFMNSQLRKTELLRTDLQHTSLYGADMYKALITDAKLKSTNLIKTLLAGYKS